MQWIRICNRVNKEREAQWEAASPEERERLVAKWQAEADADAR